MGTISSTWKKIITTIHKTDPDFPRRLLRIGEDCPEVIYCRGNLDLLKQHKRVAIIGARAANRQGCGAAYRLGQVWAQQGYVVVSGLALGYRFTPLPNNSE